MKLQRWISLHSGDELRKLAGAIGAATNYLYYVARNRPSAGLAKKIEKATKKLTPDHVITKESLRPDIWPKVKK